MIYPSLYFPALFPQGGKRLPVLIGRQRLLKPLREEVRPQGKRRPGFVPH